MVYELRKTPKMRIVIALVILAISADALPIIGPQFTIIHQTPSITFSPHLVADQHEGLAHPAVVQNAIAESQLPPELQNPFYKNPAIAAALAKESWFTNKEFPIRHREAEKIPRSEIFKIIQRIQHA